MKRKNQKLVKQIRDILKKKEDETRALLKLIKTVTESGVSTKK